MPDDVIIELACHVGVIGNLALSCKRLHRLLLLDNSVRSEVFLAFRGREATSRILLAAAERDGGFQRNHDLYLAIASRPAFIQSLPDNVRLDIVNGGVNAALQRAFTRPAVAVWTSLLPDRDVVDTKTLVNLLRWGRVSKLKALMASGTRCHIPRQPVCLPIELFAGAFEENVEDLPLCLKHFGPDCPTSISIDPMRMSFGLLQAYLEHFKDAWQGPLAAKHLRQSYNGIREKDFRRYQLMRRYDPLHSLSQNELLMLLQNCIRTGMCSDDVWETFVGILDHGEVSLVNLGLEYLLAALNPMLDHRISKRIVEAILPNLMDSAGAAAMFQLGRLTLDIWDSPSTNDYDIYTTTGYNAYTFTQAYRMIVSRLNPDEDIDIMFD